MMCRYLTVPVNSSYPEPPLLADLGTTGDYKNARLYPSQFGISFSLEADWGHIWKLRLSQPTVILKYCEDLRLSNFQRWP